MPVPELPPELWLHLASSLSPEELQALKGVNRIFLHLALNERYKNVSVKHLLRPETSRLLYRLEDPFIANFVQCLRLDVSVTVIPQHSSSHDDTNSTAITTSSRLFSVVRHVLASFVSSVPIEHHHHHHHQRQLSNSSSGSSSSSFTGDLTNRLLLAQTQFCNLTQLDLQFWGPTFDVDLHLLTHELWKCHGTRLRKLALGGTLIEYSRILPQEPGLLPQLEELTLKFCEETLNSEVLCDCVAKFVNQLKDQLISFTLLSWAAGSLETLFSAIQPFSSRLEKLRIRAPFNQAFRERGNGLKRLLMERSGSLNELELRLNPLGAVFDPSSEAPLAQWMASNLVDNDKMLATLKTLEIYPSRLLDGWNATLSICRRSQRTLTRLTIRDRYFLLEEIRSLMDALSPGHALEYLRINVKMPSVELIDLLAKCLPNLNHLQLYFGNGGAADSSMILFKENLKSREYPTWQLRELEIWQSGHRIQLKEICSENVQRCFPWLTE